jgi:acetyl-CoA carboxylase biotin carboxylase subunit
VDGIATTIPLHRRLAEHPDIAEYAVHTGWLEAWLAQTQFASTEAETGGA